MDGNLTPVDAEATIPVQDACYLYCVAPAFDLSGLDLRGLDDAAVYQIAFREISAVVHDCPAVPYAGDDERVQAWLLAHHAVIDRVWDQTGTVLPLTFDVIIKGGSGQQAREQVVAWLKENYESFRDKLNDLQGTAELVIQVNWDRAAAMQEIGSTDSEVGQLQEELQGKPKGIVFFYRQKIEKLVRQKADAIVEAICHTYLERIRALAVQTSINKPKHLDSLEMLLHLSVLVDREKISEIGMVLGELEARQGIAIHFTGPWPPYSFAMTPRGCEKTDCLERGESVEEKKTGGDILTAMLRLARKLESDGQFHEACDLYFKILDSSGETDEAEAAREALLAIAYDYERKGLVHMALDLYEKLL
jgi:tetratricopeptide (TPR) repeat protein